MKLRSLAVGLSLLTAGTVIGVSSQHFASAEISTGDRPVLVPIEPCRLVDTRPGAGVGPRATPLGTAETLVVAAQQAATPCTGAIPAEALSLALNVTAIGATAGTFLTIWADGDRPLASSLNPAPGQPPTPNAVTADLATDQTFRIYNDLGNVGLLVDVVGYYEHHNHDDRYFTESEFLDVLAPSVAVSEGRGLGSFDFVGERLPGPPDTVTTDRAGHLIVTRSFAGGVSCFPEADRIIFLTVNDAPVRASALVVDSSDSARRIVQLTGATEAVYPAGTHTIAVAAECRGSAVPQTTFFSNDSISSVVVLPVG